MCRKKNRSPRETDGNYFKNTKCDCKNRAECAATQI